jgi:hypothetical protein
MNLGAVSARYARETAATIRSGAGNWQRRCEARAFHSSGLNAQKAKAGTPHRLLTGGFWGLVAPRLWVISLMSWPYHANVPELGPHLPGTHWRQARCCGILHVCFSELSFLSLACWVGISCLKDVFERRPFVLATRASIQLAFTPSRDSSFASSRTLLFHTLLDHDLRSSQS